MLELIDHARVVLNDPARRAAHEAELQAFAAMLSWLPDNYQCTPHWNLSTNDDGLVTADEFREAINAWRNPGEPNGDEDRPGDWQQWISFLTDASVNDGFVVY